MKEKRIRTAAAVFCLGGLLCMGTTAAYFTDFKETANSFEVGHNTTGVEEEFPAPSPQPLDKNPEYKKTVWVSNGSVGEAEHAVPCYVRLSLAYSDSDIGKAVSLLNLNTTEWIYNEKDGFYYYRKVLDPGKKTESLFTGFRINSDKIEEKYKEQVSEFRIHVYEESVQSEGFTDYQEAWAHYLNAVSTGKGGKTVEKEHL